MSFYINAKLSPSSNHLNLTTAKNILIQTEGGKNQVLELDYFKTADLDALSLIEEYEFDFVDIGLNVIDVRAAEIIASWKSYGLIFTSLEILEFVCAEKLSNSEHLLSFENEVAWECMTPETARALAKNKAPVYVHLKQLTREVALSFAPHKHELSLTLDSPITERVAHALLNKWDGFRLDLRLPSLPSPWTIAVLKRMRKQTKTQRDGWGEVVCEIRNETDPYIPYSRIIGPSDPYEV